MRLGEDMLNGIECRLDFHNISRVNTFISNLAIDGPAGLNPAIAGQLLHLGEIGGGQILVEREGEATPSRWAALPAVSSRWSGGVASSRG